MTGIKLWINEIELTSLVAPLNAVNDEIMVVCCTNTASPHSIRFIPYEIRKVNFTLDSVSKTTPFKKGYFMSDAVTVVMPENVGVIDWAKWIEDSDTNRTKNLVTSETLEYTGLFLNPPTAPSNLSGEYSEEQITITWNNNASEADNNYVERSDDGGEWTIIATLGSTETSYIDLDVECGVSYDYRVRCDFEGMYSDYAVLSSPIMEECPLPLSGEPKKPARWTYDYDFRHVPTEHVQANTVYQFKQTRTIKAMISFNFSETRKATSGLIAKSFVQTLNATGEIIAKFSETIPLVGVFLKKFEESVAVESQVCQPFKQLLKVVGVTMSYEEYAYKRLKGVR